MKTIRFALYDGSSISVPVEDESEVTSNGDELLGDSSVGQDDSTSADDSDISSVDDDTGDSSISEDGSFLGSPGEEGRQLLTTPLDEYTVTEGLLLLVVLILALYGLISMFRGR